MPTAITESIELTTPAMAASPSFNRRDSSSTLAKDSRPTSIAALPDLSGQYALAETGLGVQEEQVRQRRLRRMSGSEPQEGLELPPVDKGVGAWSFVCFAFVLECFVWAYGYSFPTVLVYLQQTPPWSSSSLAELSAIGSVGLALLFFCPILAVAFFRRYPDWRVRVLFAMIFVNCGSMLVASWATKTWHLIVLQGVLVGFSGAVLYAPVLMFLNDWFAEKRGLSSGIVFAGSSIGGIGFPFLINSILEKHGFATMCRIWACVTFAAFTPAVYFVKPRVPSQKPKHGERAPWLAVSPKLLLDPIVLVMFTLTFLFSLPYYQVSFYLPTYTLSLSASSSSTIVVGLVNGAAAIGAIAIGWASDRSLPWTMTVLGLASGFIALLAWGYASSLAVVFAFAVGYTFFTPVFSLWGAGAREAVGANPHASTMVVSSFSIARGIASIVGPFIGTALYDPHEAESRPKWGRFGFSRVIIAVGVLSLLSSLGGPALAWARREKTRRKIRDGAGR
ncbi:hypothetical protein JCM11641_006027 [Rhodosporidiobolus odoratus]